VTGFGPYSQVALTGTEPYGVKSSAVVSPKVPNGSKTVPAIRLLCRSMVSVRIALVPVLVSS
jgi:hypothetical protein